MRLLRAIFNVVLFIVSVLAVIYGSQFVGRYCVPSDPLLGFLVVMSFEVAVAI